MDFCSVIALEIEDKLTHTFTCAGIAFEVRKNDSEIKKFVYFSHSGKIPEPGYITADGYCYSNSDIKRLINERSQNGQMHIKGDVNRISHLKCQMVHDSLYVITCFQRANLRQ